MFDSANGDFDIQKKHINDKGDFVITAGLTNNGILGKTDVKSKLFNKNTITIDMFGAAFYRQFNYKMVTHARVFALLPKFEITYYQGLFLANSLHFLPSKFGYENMCSWNKIQSFKIQLPIKNRKIDFDFMERFVAKLENESILKLENYLNKNGLSNYHLTEKEKIVLENYVNLKFKEFNITDVFNIKNTGNILSRDIIPNSGTTPYLCASSDNNGVSSYISYDKNYIDKGDCVFIGGKTFVVSYQENDFFSNDSHNLVLYLKDTKAKSKLNQLFLASCINKSLSHIYSWGYSISNKKIQKDKVSLPIKDGKPDYKTMGTIISAIHKLVIKDVVLYVERKKKELNKLTENTNADRRK